MGTVGWLISRHRVAGNGRRTGIVKPDPLHRFFEAGIDGKPCFVEYESDRELRDFKQIPLLEDGDIEAFVRREVRPDTKDAWLVASGRKIGYGIGFTHYFCQPPQLHSMAEISTDIPALEQETDGLLREIARGVAH